MMGKDMVVEEEIGIKTMLELLASTIMICVPCSSVLLIQYNQSNNAKVSIS